jgi:hypothetical protein
MAEKERSKEELGQTESITQDAMAVSHMPATSGIGLGPQSLNMEKERARDRGQGRPISPVPVWMRVCMKASALV